MKTIEQINGVTVENLDGNRTIKYLGEVCPLIKRKEIRCEQSTSYKGHLLDSWETYQTPIGIVERHYWARGAGLEESGIDWRLIPQSEIEEAQERFRLASIEMEEARFELSRLQNAQ